MHPFLFKGSDVLSAKLKQGWGMGYGMQDVLYLTVFTHYLITRFNIRIDGMGPEKIASPPMDDAWLQARLQYFEAYCAKSVCDQSNVDFTWLIYFDTNTSPQVLDRLANVKQGGPVIEFVMVDHFDMMLDDVRARLRSTTQPFVITTRLDNDDLLANDFMQRVQDAFVPEPLALINFNSGFEYDTELNLVKKWNQRFHNQFISLVEKKGDDELLTVYGFPHWGPPPDVVEINLESPSAWMHLRHVNNYSPNTYKAIPVFRSRALAHFPIERKLDWKAMVSTLSYTLRWFPRMILRRFSSTA